MGFGKNSASLLRGRGSRVVRLLVRVRMLRKLIGPLRLEGFVADVEQLAGPFLDQLHALERRSVLVHVPAALCRISGLLAFPIDGRRYNPFLQTLNGVRLGRVFDYSHSPLRRYHEAWQPTCAAELLGIPEDRLGEALRGMPPYAAIWPWHRYSPEEQWASVRASITEENRVAGLPAPEQAGHENFGPVRLDKGALEFQRLVGLMERIEQRGYLRHARKDGDIEGVILRSGSNAAVLIKKGKHRACALAALGYRQLPIRLFASRRAVIDCRQALSWGAVRAGHITETDATAVVRRMIGGEQPFDYRPVQSPVDHQQLSDV